MEEGREGGNHFPGQLMAVCLASSESKPPAAGGGEGGGISTGFAKTPHCCHLKGFLSLWKRMWCLTPPLCAQVHSVQYVEK